MDDVSDIRPEESVLPGKALIVDMFRGLEVVFHALIGGGCLRFSAAVGVGLRGRKLELPVDGLGRLGVAAAAGDGAGAGVGVEELDVLGGEGEVALLFAELGNVGQEEDEVRSVGRGTWGGRRLWVSTRNE